MENFFAVYSSALIIIITCVVIGVIVMLILFHMNDKKPFSVWGRAAFASLILFPVLTACVAILTIESIHREQQEQAVATARQEANRITETAQLALSHFIEDVHGGYLEDGYWQLNDGSFPVLTETTQRQLFVWLPVQDYDITYTQLMNEINRGRTGLERYVDFFGVAASCG